MARALLRIECPHCGAADVEVHAEPEIGPGMYGLAYDVLDHKSCENEWTEDEHTTAYCRIQDAYEEWEQPPDGHDEKRRFDAMMLLRDLRNKR